MSHSYDWESLRLIGRDTEVVQDVLPRDGLGAKGHK